MPLASLTKGCFRGVGVGGSGVAVTAVVVEVLVVAVVEAATLLR